MTRKNHPRFFKRNKCKYDKKTTLVQGLEGRLSAFVEHFKSIFYLQNSSADLVSEKYLNGLFLSDKKNCDKISEKVDSNSQSLNHFISNSPWDYNLLFSQIALFFVKVIPVAWLDDLCLTIDETSFPKKGNSSVGVAHQYCGQLGKLANCQVGVFACLVCRNLYCLVYAMLYLPQKWCIKSSAAIPGHRKNYKSKIDLAREIIFTFKVKLKIPFKWVCFDSFYGRDTSLLSSLDLLGIKFVADIPRNTNVFKTKPELILPKKSGKKGRTPCKLTVKGRSIKVSNIVKSLKNSDFKSIQLRKNREGKKVEAMFYTIPVFIPVKEDGVIIKAVLLIRKDKDGTIRYSLSNAVDELIERLAYMQGQRYFIERSFQETKQHLGLNEYQIRGYEGWHRHMAMTSLGMLFMQTEKKLYNENDLHISIPTLARIIIKLLPQKIMSIEEILEKSVTSIIVKDRKNIRKSVT